MSKKWRILNLRNLIIILVIAAVVLLILHYGGRYWFRNRVAAIAIAEHKRFGNGIIKEQNMEPEITRYWAEGLNMPHQSVTAVPWSAAFISWVIRKAGAGKKFKYSARHSTYIHWAIENLKNNKGHFRAYQPKTKPLQVGDMVCYARQSGVNYDTGTDYDSHCDIITSISKRNGTAIGIGGNVSNSVSATTYNINKEGYITSPKIFAVIKPNINAWL